jgi:hypothetical protein
LGTALVGPRQKIAWLSLVLAKSLSVEATAKRYGVTARTVQRWAWNVPISCRIAHGARRISTPLCDAFVAGAGKELWALIDGHVAEIIVDAFNYHGVGAALTEYAKKVGHLRHPDVVAAGGALWRPGASRNSVPRKVGAAILPSNDDAAGSRSVGVHPSVVVEPAIGRDFEIVGPCGPFQRLLRRAQSSSLQTQGSSTGGVLFYETFPCHCAGNLWE